jgi:hypothetical protein
MGAARFARCSKPMTGVFSRMTWWSALCACALTAGCNQAAPSSTTDTSNITASELATLLDFHVWKLPITTSNEFSAAQIALVKPDGTSNLKWGTSYSVPRADWTNLLLGLRLEQGRVSGRFSAHGPKLNESWEVSFTNSPDEHVRYWVGEHLRWTGDYAVLGGFYTGNPRSTRDTNDSLLVLQLVRAPRL